MRTATSELIQKQIDILDVTPLRGPNIWTYVPVLEVLVDIGDLEDCPSNCIPGFPERLEQWIPSLVEHRCSYEVRGGFLRRLHEGTWPGHVLEHVALELQGLAGMPGGFGRARETSRPGVYKVVVATWEEEVTLAAVRMARDLVLDAMNGDTYDVTAAVDRLRAMSDTRCLGPGTQAIVTSALRHRIPVVRLNEGNLVQLGYGSRQQRIWTSETDRTGAIAHGIARDRTLSRRLLADCGIPVPEDRVVHSVDDAWAAAEDIGLPVVVKPEYRSRGRGIFLELTTREAVEAAYGKCLEDDDGVRVERFVRGAEFRLLVVGGKVVAAARDAAAWVTGDGLTPLVDLVKAAWCDNPALGVIAHLPVAPERVDTLLRLELANQKLSPDAVPAQGARVRVRTNHRSADVTDRVHPAVAATAVRAARVIGLDIAGIDMIMEDVARPLEDQGGVVADVNTGPNLARHLHPHEGTARPVGDAIVAHLFPDPAASRIPVIGIAGSHAQRRATVAQLLAIFMHLDGIRAGLACSTGAYVGGRRITAGDCAHWQAATHLLMNRSVDVAIIENGMASMAGEGLAYDRCRIGVVTGLDPGDSLPARDLQNPEAMFKVLRTQIDVVLPEGTGVLAAEDPAVARMAALCDGEVIFYGADPAGEVLAEHVAMGRRAVSIRNGTVVLQHGSLEIPVLHTTAPPIAAVWNRLDANSILAAIAAGWAMELGVELMASGIETWIDGPAMDGRSADFGALPWN